MAGQGQESSPFKFEVICADSYNFRYIGEFLSQIVAKKSNKKSNFFHLISQNDHYKKY